MICKLGSGTSYAVIEKLDTENTYNMIEKQPQNEFILPDGVLEEVFTLAVASKIDRKEKHLSGKNSSFTKGRCKLLLMTLLNSFFLFYYYYFSFSFFDLSYNFSD